MIKVKMTLTDDEGHRRRSKVTENELMVISRKLLHSQTSYLVPRHNTISDILWHQLSWPWRKVKVTPQLMSKVTDVEVSAFSECFLSSCFLSFQTWRMFVQLAKRPPSTQLLYDHCSVQFSRAEIESSTPEILGSNLRWWYEVIKCGMSLLWWERLHFAWVWYVVLLLYVLTTKCVVT